ncbi:MAG: VanZ family protein [Christensenellales bacterium]|jgi:VanZ family protein
MKKARGARWLPWAAVGVWMCVIFAFSAQDGAASTHTSEGFMAFMARFIPALGDPAVSGAVRTFGHFSEFTLLGLLLAWAIVGSAPSLPRALIAQGVGMLYAASDEFHQLFVPGRACELSDWLVDSAGVLIGLGLFLLLRALVRRARS